MINNRNFYKNGSDKFMKFYSRKMVAAKDLNSNGSLFGGRLLAWIDEEAFIFTTCQLKDPSVVTRYISNIEFLSTARIGDIVEIGMEVVEMGRTSITLACVVRKKGTEKIITQIDKIVFVLVDHDGQPKPHYQKVEFIDEAI